MFCTNCGSSNPDGVKFCSACGEPLEVIDEEVKVTANESVQQNLGYPQQESTPVIPQPQVPVYDDENVEKEKKRNKTILLVILIAVPLLLIAAVIILCVMLLGNGKTAVSKAFNNTIEEFKENNELYKALDIENLIEGGNYTVSADIDTELSGIGDVSLYSEIGIGDSVAQVSGDINLSVIPSVEYLIQVDESEVRAYTPLLDKYMFVYNYKNNNTGYLMDEIDAEAVNTVISEAYQVIVGKSFDFSEFEKLGKELAEVAKDMDFSKGKAKKLEIDGKEVSCKNYVLKPTLEDALNFADVLEKFFNENYSDVSELAKIKDALSELRVSISMNDFTDTQISVSVYNNKLADICVSDGISESAIEFCGGDYRAQSIKIVEDGIVIGQLIGTKNGQVEKMTFEDGDSNAYVSYEYDPSDGRFTISTYGMDDFSMKLKREEDRLDLTLDYIDFGDTYFGGKISLKKGVEIKEMSGERFDIGQAGEDEVESLIYEVSGLLYGLLGF